MLHPEYIFRVIIMSYVVNNDTANIRTHCWRPCLIPDEGFFLPFFYFILLYSSFSHHDIVLPVLRVFRCWKSFILEKSILIEPCLHFVLGMLQTFPLLQKYWSVGVHFLYSITFLVDQWSQLFSPWNLILYSFISDISPWPLTWNVLRNL